MLFFLSQHDVDRIVQHDIGDARRGLCHEHPRLWFAPRQKRQRADMILMSVGDNNGVNTSLGDWKEIRGCGETLSLWMHAAIQDNRLPLCSEKVGICPDLHVPRQIPELHRLYAMHRKLRSGSAKFIFCEPSWRPAVEAGPVKRRRKAVLLEASAQLSCSSFPMSTKPVTLYDTTLRDGTQGTGISFSVLDKIRVAEKLDAFGIDYIEGGWPGSNPKDAAFFDEAARARDGRMRRSQPLG